MWKLDAWTDKEYEEFVLYLKGLEDIDYRKFHSNLLPGIKRIIGIRTPKMRELAKQITKGDYESFLKQSDLHILKGQSFYEQVVIEGMVIGDSSNKKIPDIDRTKEYIRAFAPKIDNWATCDNFCSGMKVIHKFPQEFWEFVLDYVDSSSEFEVRMGIVLLMNYYLTEEYIERVLLKCDEVNREDYYINMAIAWLISVAYVKFETKTLDYLEENHLSEFTYNKALQKIIESNRVSNEKKEFIKNRKKTRKSRGII
ncbi:MAG: DNA alkylation repair protein [Velocimicrobium sp.]